MKENVIKIDPLEDFINNNDKLLSVLGVFVAIVALVVGSTSWELNVVAFVSIGGIILLGYTILTKIDKKTQSFQLQLFRYIILWGGTAFIIYWVSKFRLIWNLVLWIPATAAIFAFVGWSLLPLVRKFHFTRHLLGIGVKDKKWYQKMIRFVSVLSVFIFSLVFGIWLSVGTNVIFDFMTNNFIK